jgi:hypothetical protein
MCASDKVSIYVNLGTKLANKATQLDWTSVLGIFARSIANMTSVKGKGGMLLDSVLMCTVLLIWPQYSEVSQDTSSVQIPT